MIDKKDSASQTLLPNINGDIITHILHLVKKVQYLLHQAANSILVMNTEQRIEKRTLPMYSCKLDSFECPPVFFMRQHISWNHSP